MLNNFAGGQVERWLRYAGLVRLDKVEPLDATRILAPEVLMLAVSILVLVVCRALNRRHSGRMDVDQLLPVINAPPSDAEQITQRRKYSMLTILGTFSY